MLVWLGDAPMAFAVCPSGLSGNPGIHDNSRRAGSDGAEGWSESHARIGCIPFAGCPAFAPHFPG